MTSRLLAVAVMCALSGAAAAATNDTLTPTSVASATAIAPDVSQTVITYQVTDSASTPVGTFTYDPTTQVWTAPAGWLVAIDPATNDPIPGTFVKNANTPTQETVVFPNPTLPANQPSLSAGAATTTAVEPTFTGATVSSTVLGAASVISDVTIDVSAPGTATVTANPDPISYTYQNTGDPTLDTAGGAAYNGVTSASSSATATAEGDVTVTSSTPAYQTGTYTVAFDGTSTTGTLTGGSVDLSGNGLFFNALTGSGSVDTTTGVVTTTIVAMPTTAITSSGIATNALTVAGATTTGSLAVTGNTTTGSLTVTGGTVTNGINNSGQRITNVAPGVAGTDAVNVNQLNAGLDSLNEDFTNQINTVYRRMDDNRTKASQGIAAIAAMTNVPQVDTGKKFAIGAGFGGYDSEYAGAVGASLRISEDWVVKATVGFGDETAYGAGVSASW